MTTFSASGPAYRAESHTDILGDKRELRVAAFTAGRNAPGARFRVRQYIPGLRHFGIEVDEFWARWGSYPPDAKSLRPLWLMGTVLSWVPPVLKSHRYDLAWLQREMVSTLTTLEPFTKRPRILDVDDAVWLNRGGRTGFGKIARMCDGVICGNSFIAENVRPWNEKILVLPTPVDTQRYVPSPKGRTQGRGRILGWSGLSFGLQYVYGIEEALAAVLAEHKDVVLRIVSDKPPQFRRLLSSQFEYVPWSPQSEVQAIQEMSVGLMPVEDSLWARGKCSYKMLLYMSCGIPVVVSPVGMNEEVLAQGRVGFGPKSISEWAETLEWLLQNPEQGYDMGRTGREIIEQHYSVQVCAPRLASFLRDAAEHRVGQRLRASVAARDAGPLAAAAPLSPEERRFAFGKNWTKFLRLIDEPRIARATESVERLLGTGTVQGRSFVDVGSGTGLFSLAAMRLGAAAVHSFDYDPDCVSCAEYLKQRFFPGASTWTIEQGDVLNREYLERLGAFDVVYSWGVLHHTGQMWRALENIAQLVRPGGRLVLALYNDQGWRSRYWRSIKRAYNSGTLARAALRCVFIPSFFLGYLAKDLVRWRSPLDRFRGGFDKRGMSSLRDVEDWLGGYPFEVTRPELVTNFYASKGFQTENVTTVGRKLGCNEFVFRFVGGPPAGRCSPGPASS